MKRITISQARYILFYENNNLHKINELKSYFKSKKALSFYQKNFGDIPSNAIFILFHLATESNSPEVLRWLLNEKIQTIELTEKNSVNIYNNLMYIIKSINFNLKLKHIINEIMEIYPTTIILAFLNNNWINYYNDFKTTNGYLQSMTLEEKNNLRSLEQVITYEPDDCLSNDEKFLAYGHNINIIMKHEINQMEQITFDAYGYKNIVTFYPKQFSCPNITMLKCIQIPL